MMPITVFLFSAPYLCGINADNSYFSMPIYHQLGTIPDKRHITFRQPNGNLYQEELVGTQGFAGLSFCFTLVGGYK